MQLAAATSDMINFLNSVETGDVKKKLSHWCWAYMSQLYGGRGEVPHCPVAGNAGEYDVLCVLQVIYKGKYTSN